MTNTPSDYLINLTNVLNSVAGSNFNQLLNYKKLIKTSKRLIICGNGGCASTASHFCCDLIKKCEKNAICLNDNMAILTAYANDISYSDVFVEYYKQIFNNDDLCIILSGSGNSENCLKLAEFCNKNNITILTITGQGGKLKEYTNMAIEIQFTDMQLLEDSISAICHSFVK